MDKVVAIVELGGKQHLVHTGDQLVVNRLNSEPDAQLTLTDLLSNQPVTVKILSHGRGPKVSGLKFKAKTRYLKHYGHRQDQTRVEVVSIGAMPKSQSETKPAARKTSASKPASPKKATTGRKKVTNG